MALALASVGQMLTVFALSALNVGFPVIEADLDVERTVLAWAVSGYAIATAAFLLASGRVADRVGSKRVFLGGVATFTAGAALSAAAPGVGVLIVGRVLQGLGAAAMIPSSLSITLHEFPTDRRSFAVGAWGGVAAIAGALGPPGGAALIELGGWRLVFVASIPLGVLVVAVGARVLRDASIEPVPGRLDMVSGPLAAGAIGLVVAALLQSPTWGWGDVRVIVAIAAAPVLVALLIRRSAVHPTPLLDLGLFGNRRFVVASTTTTVYNAAVAGYWLAAPLFLQTIWGWNVLESGLGIVPTPLIHVLLVGPMGRLADRGHHRALMVSGALVTATGTGGLAMTVTDAPSYWTAVLPFTIVIGVGGAMAWPVFTSAALVEIRPKQFGEANGVNLTMRQLGAALGVAVVIAVIGNQGSSGVDAFRQAWWFATGGLVLVALTVAWTYPRRPPVARSSGG